MKYEFTNDEVFVLSAICGSTSVTGVANPFVAMDDDEMEEAIQSIAGTLMNAGVVSRSEGHYKVDDETSQLIKTVSQPDTAYVLAGEEEDNEYVFLKGNEAVYLLNKNLEMCYLESFQAKEELKAFLRSKLDFIKIHQDSLQYVLSVSSGIVDKAIAQTESGNIEEALKTMGADSIDRDEIQGMLEGIVFGEETKTIIQCSFGKESAEEAIFKICNTPKGTWIVKISTIDECRNTMIFKATVDDITKILFEF